ncbi:MAG: sphingomyelin phosphodiesterase [Coxiellaceae bacterium]|nr:sphingomyelin phosphodiesterase [Coxiellaceae bacterium]
MAITKYYKLLAYALLLLLSYLPVTGFTCALQTSHFFLTNQTSKLLSVVTRPINKNAQALSDKIWDGHQIIMPAYKSDQAFFWVARMATDPSMHQLTWGKTYDFDTQITPLDTKTQQPIITETAHLMTQIRTTFLSSTISHTMIMPDHHRIAIPFNNVISRLPKKAGFSFWGSNDMALYTLRWPNIGSLYDNFHLVISNLNKNQPLSKPTPDKNTLSVLTYNVQEWPAGMGGPLTGDDLNHPRIRARVIPALVKNYDVVVMQELFGFAAPLNQLEPENILIKHMDGGYPITLRAHQAHFFHVLHPATGYQQINYAYVTDPLNFKRNIFKKPFSGGVMVFSKYPIEKVVQSQYSDCSRWDCLAAKGVLYVKINKKGKHYHLFATHRVAGEATLIANLTQFSHFVHAQNIPSSEPVIAVGDFNADQYTPGDLNGLVNIIRMNILPIINYPYSSDPSIDRMHTGVMTKNRLDYISPMKGYEQPIVNDVNPQQASYNRSFILRCFTQKELWDTGDLMSKFPTAFDLSDHLPVDAVLRYMH